jgi:hypothetical protein
VGVDPAQVSGPATRLFPLFFAIALSITLSITAIIKVNRILGWMEYTLEAERNFILPG